MSEGNDSIISKMIEWLTLQLGKSIKLIRDGRRSQEIFGSLKMAIQAFNDNRPFQIKIIDPNIISIDRNQPFNPIELLGEHWVVVEQDERSLACTQLNLNSVCLRSMLSGDEPFYYICGDERCKRLKKGGHIRLDAKILQTLWESQYLIPDGWKKEKGKDDMFNGKTIYIFFDGTVLQNLEGPSHYKYVLALCWNQCNGWFLYPRRVDDAWRAYHLSALLEIEAPVSSPIPLD